MLRLGSWLRPRAVVSEEAAAWDEGRSQEALDDLDDAMAAASMMMNDKIDAAEERLRLRKDDSVFHVLGFGVILFLRSIIGVETDVVAEASAWLLDAESRVSGALKKARASGAGARAPASIFPAGSEYGLVLALLQLMGAVVAVTQESWTDIIRAFYKLRKAFISLESIVEAGEETALLQELDAANPAPGQPQKPTLGRQYLASIDGGKHATMTITATLVDDSSSTDSRSDSTASSPLPPSVMVSLASEEPLPRPANPLDAFIHSSANMCLGVLLVIIAMVPPTLSKLLHLVGFKGDRDRGLRMLWQTTLVPSAVGAVAGMVLMEYYNGLLVFADIRPGTDDELAAAGAADVEAARFVGYPRRRCAALLARMRDAYPDSVLWRLQEARGRANERMLDEAIALLQGAAEADGTMRQVRALVVFELTLNAMFVMDWKVMAEGCLRCVELNDWSHAMYYYMAGCAELEMYRDAAQTLLEIEKAGETGVAVQGLPGNVGRWRAVCAKHREAAESHFKKVPEVAGRKRLMSRRVAFEDFVLRKVRKWSERSAALAVDFVDAIGLSPAQEMIYLWNGSKRMDGQCLEKALAGISWDRCAVAPATLDLIAAQPDEAACKAVVEAAILRERAVLSPDASDCIRKCELARNLLENEVLCRHKSDFNGPTKDDYPLPAAHYELAVIYWVEAAALAKLTIQAAERGCPRAADGLKEKISLCQRHLEIVSRWDAFVLDSRIGVRVRAGLDTLQWWTSRRS